MARGNWRNWEGKELKQIRLVECLWCGWRWRSRVPKDPVCPKCNMINDTARLIIDNPKGHPVYGWKWNLLRKTWAKRNYYRNHPEELRL